MSGDMGDFADLGDEGFNSEEYEPAGDFDVLPAAWYPAVLIDSEMKLTKKEDGKYLACEFEIIDGQFKGRKAWANINMTNPSAECVRIGRGQLSALCKACGKPKPKDSSELRHIPIQLKLGVRRRQDTGELSNVVKAYKAAGESTSSSGAAGGGAEKPAWLQGQGQ